MKKWSISILTIILLTFSILAGCSSSSSKEASSSGENTKSGETQTLKLISFLSVDHMLTKDIIPMWIDMVEKELDGEVKIEWIGGPESIPATEQFNAVKNGLVDINFNASSQFSNLMPESDSMLMSPFTLGEERENGYFDYLGQLFEKNGVVYLGRWLSEEPFYFWSNKEVSSLAELKGAKFRSNPIYHGTMDQLGMVQVDVHPSDVYTSLERNLVEGFGFTLLGPRESGWTEITKYVIDEPFLNQNTMIMINPNSFNGLSAEAQKKMIEVTAKFETEMANYFIEKNEEEWKALKEDGVKVIDISQKDRDLLQKHINEQTWKSLEKNIDKDTVKELKGLLNK
ncbi:TRAP transporter substrate-binding protein DctP [Bacillus tuaregi]|uniref:TRAP transporter substrate-binding protein DctP n=1 Tax=Bacillus tuaregi TaxID=1816695 RepID=UPI0008F8F8E4|nr:TRAP transporter substrate-binding protein DctP [Bacillus tuaregi]